MRKYWGTPRNVIPANTLVLVAHLVTFSESQWNQFHPRAKKPTASRGFPWPPSAALPLDPAGGSAPRPPLQSPSPPTANPLASPLNLYKGLNYCDGRAAADTEKLGVWQNWALHLKKFLDEKKLFSSLSEETQWNFYFISIFKMHIFVNFDAFLHFQLFEWSRD